MLERLGRGAARHHRIVLVAWLVAVIAVGAAAGAWGGKAYDSFSIPGTGSQEAIDLLEQDFPAAAGASATVVFRTSSGTVEDAAAKAAIEQVVKALGALPDATTAVDPFAPTSSGYVSPQKTIAYTSVSFSEQATELPTDTFEQIQQAAAPARDAGLQVAYGGAVVEAQDTSEAKGGLSEYADVIGLGFAVVILLVSLGSVVAMSLPIGTALAAIVVSSSLLTLAESQLTVGTAAGPIGVMIGLGVGIDYSLFIVSRFRQEVHGGASVEDAVGLALGRAGSAVLFAGMSVCIALVGLFLVGIPYVTTLGLTAALFVIGSVTAALTLLPALLGAVGAHIDRWSIHRKGARTNEGRASRRWAQLVGRHAVLFSLLGLAILAVLSAPALRMDLGFPSAGDDPPGDTQRLAYDWLDEGFGAGVNGPLLVVVRLPVDAAAGAAGTTTTTGPPTTAATDVAPPAAQELLAVNEEAAPLLEALGKADGVTAVTPVLPNSAGTVGIIEVTPSTGPADPRTTDLVRDLREDVIPQAVAGTPLAGAEVYVGGSTAVLIDLTDLISGRLAFVIGGVVLAAFVLLMMVFRSVLVPATAAVMNLLSIGAAYGVLVAVFQWGWGKGAIGLSETIPVAPFIPVMMFAILFGLSMDYEVFLLSRIREAYVATGDARTSVADGLAGTARVITSAALIMISVFLAFVTNPNPIVKMMGFGMAVAVFVDATVVRMLLVPSVMELLGRANWWMPGWLDRVLPHIAVEGAPPAADAGT